MSYLQGLRSVLLLALTVCFSTMSYAQKGTVNIEANPKVEQLLALKKEANRKAENVYRIQIFSGTASQARGREAAFKERFPGWKCDLKFETPNYKVWVGNFRTRLEADRRLLEVKKRFPNAFILAPQKRRKS